MSGLEIAAVITAIGSIVGLFINARKLDETLTRISESERREDLNRRDIVLLGEQYSMTRTDNEIIAAAFNQLWLEIYQMTGQRPKANLDMLNRLTTIRQSQTGRLGPLDEEALHNFLKR